jgi:hypothetical protein
VIRKDEQDPTNTRASVPCFVWLRIPRESANEKIVSTNQGR